MTNTNPPLFVFLDTELFDANKLCLSSPAFKRLRNLVAQRLITVVSTEVTEREIDSHFERKAAEITEAVHRLRTVVGRSAIQEQSFFEPLNGFDENAIRQEFEKSLNSYREDVKAIVVKSDKINLRQVLDQYFSKQPPFGDGKKKSEFPDAMAASALMTWCMESKQSLYIVSRDQDWNRIAMQVDSFTHCETLTPVFEILAPKELSKEILDTIPDKLLEIEMAVKREFPNCWFAIPDAVEGEVEEVKVKSVSLTGFHVVGADHGLAEIEFDCEVVFEADVNFYDPDLWVYDSDDRAAVYTEVVEDTIEVKKEITGFATISYKALGDLQLALLSVALTDDMIELEVDD